MLRGMSIKHFAEWRAYGDLEPWDETRADLRAADVVRTLLNLGREGKKVQLKDCVLQFGREATEPEKQPTVEEARAQVRGVMDLLVGLHSEPGPKSKRKAR